MTISAWKLAVGVLLTTAAGFVGGIWFIGAGVNLGMIPDSMVSTPGIPKIPPRPAPPQPKVKAVAVPPPANFSGGSGGLGQRAARADLLPSPGCSWVIEPRPFRFGDQWHSTDPERALGGYSAVDPPSGALHYLLVQSTRKGGVAMDLRPVVFDAEANRHVPLNGSRGSSRSSEGVFAMNEFLFSPVKQIAPGKVAYFGIERVTPDAVRLLMEGAQREARDKGMAILPPLRLGQPYPFDLPAADGKRLRSEDFRGKAVLMVIAGPGGYSGMGIYSTRRIRETNKPEELAIVGISFDGSVEDARAAFARSGADGPLVVVPNDETTRRIWSDGAQIAYLPMFLLIDRKGVLRSNFNSFFSFDFQDRIDVLLGRARRPVLRPTRPYNPTKKAATASPAPPSTGAVPAK